MSATLGLGADQESSSYPVSEAIVGAKLVGYDCQLSSWAANFQS